MSNLITNFKFNSLLIRSFLIDGQPWFIATDVCRALEIMNSGSAVSRLDEDEKGIRLIDTLGGPQERTIISESGLYALTMGSRKPQAKEFKKWVTSCVLPEIRRTGSYSVQSSEPENPLLQLANAVITAQKVIDDQLARLNIAEPKAAALDLISESVNSRCIRDTAKELKCRPCELTEYLLRRKWIYRQHRDDGKLGKVMAYQVRIDQGYIEHSSVIVESKGQTKIATSVKITGKGFARLSLIFSSGSEVLQ